MSTRLNHINFRAGFDRSHFERSSVGLLRSMKRTTKGIAAQAGKMGVALGTAVLAREIGRLTMSFDTSMTKIETLVGLSRKQVDGFRESVLDLSGDTARKPQELADALFTVTSAGIRGSEALEVLERAAQAARVGLGDTQAIARTTTAVLQAYGVENINAAEATDTLVAIVREGNLEASELAPVLGRVIGIASTLGVSFAEVGASIATFTRLGVDSSEAVTGLLGIMNALIKPTEEGKKALAAVGLTFEDLRASVKEKGLAVTLMDLIKLFDGNVEALGDIIPNVRALATVLGTAGVQGEEYAKILKSIEGSTGILDEATKRVAETSEDKWNKALARSEELMIRMGNKALPYLTDRMNEFLDLLEDDEQDWGVALYKNMKFLAGFLGGGGNPMAELAMASNKAREEQKKLNEEVNNFKFPTPQIEAAAKSFNVIGMSGRGAATSVKEAKKEVEALLDKSNKLTTELVPLNDQIKALQEQLESQAQAGNISNATLSQFIKLSDKAAKAQKDLEDAVKKARSAFDGYDFKKMPMIDGSLSVMPEPEDDDPTIKIEDQNSALQKLEEQLNNVSSAYSAVAGAARQWLANSQVRSENEIRGLQTEIDKINERYDAESEKISESTQNARIRGDRLKGLEDKRAEEIAAYEQKITKIRNKEMRKQAIANKITSSIEAAINTALGVTKALSTGNPILAGIIGAMGAAQISLIASQQIPEFATGGSFSGGMALVGERGAELIKTSGQTKVYNNRQTMDMLSGGDKKLVAQVDGTGFLIWLEEEQRKQGNR